jgi:archaetidylinositol phosphate synthase
VSSWTHLAARPLVRPLIGSGVTPNHLTTLRLISGVAACGAFGASHMILGGWLWVLSAFLDRADGELARLGNMMSPGGHIYDYYVDNFINSLFFLCIGFGLRHGWLGAWSVPLGVVSAVALFLCNLFSEWLEQRSPPATRAYSGRWGFDPDDALYLMGPLAWLGWLAPILVAATVGTVFMMSLTGWRLARMVRKAAAA